MDIKLDAIDAVIKESLQRHAAGAQNTFFYGYMAVTGLGITLKKQKITETHGISNSLRLGVERLIIGA